jgi:hypothetical protein
MAAFYLLDCDFTENLKDNGGINYVGDSTAQDRDKLVYGVRTYYDRCIRESGNYNWHSDNLSSAENSPARGDITDSWTFNDTWNPEKEIQGLLDCAFLPNPGYRAKEVSETPTLSWLSGKNSVKHLLYFGSSTNPPFLTELTDTFYVLQEKLESATQYFWRVDEVTTEGDTIQGGEWNFYSDLTTLPEKSYNPYPPVDTNIKRSSFYLSWNARALEVDTFLLYFGSQQEPPLFEKLTEVKTLVGKLTADSTYYWRVDAQNKNGITKGDLWYFHYNKTETSAIDDYEITSDNFKVYPNPVSGDVLTLEFFKVHNSSIEISVYSLDGRSVYQKDVEINRSDNLLYTIEVDGIRQVTGNGYLILKVRINDEIEVIPLILN